MSPRDRDLFQIVETRFAFMEGDDAVVLVRDRDEKGMIEEFNYQISRVIAQLDLPISGVVFRVFEHGMFAP